MGTVVATWWFTNIAPAITMAMITAKAIGKDFTGSSCGIGNVRIGQGPPPRVARAAPESDNAYGVTATPPTGR